MEWNERGFRFSCFTDTVDGKNLPRGLLNIERGKKYIKFTTHELVSMLQQGQ